LGPQKRLAKGKHNRCPPEQKFTREINNDFFHATDNEDRTEGRGSCDPKGPFWGSGTIETYTIIDEGLYKTNVALRSDTEERKIVAHRIHRDENRGRQQRSWGSGVPTAHRNVPGGSAQNDSQDETPGESRPTQLHTREHTKDKDWERPTEQQRAGV